MGNVRGGCSESVPPSRDGRSRSDVSAVGDVAETPENGRHLLAAIFDGRAHQPQLLGLSVLLLLPPAMELSARVALLLQRVSLALMLCFSSESMLMMPEKSLSWSRSGKASQIHVVRLELVVVGQLGSVVLLDGLLGCCCDQEELVALHNKLLLL